jgi:hypothetical protein
MEHLDFIVWTILFPVAVSICRYIDNKACDGEAKSSDGVQAASSLIVLSIWASVAYLLY